MLACASSGEGLSGDDIPYLLLRMEGSSFDSRR